MSLNPLVTEATDANFKEEVLGAARPVLVKFWATWCAPCKALSPTVDALATEYEGTLKVMEMNVDDHPVTVSMLGIRGIPVLHLFKDGKAVNQVTGAVAKTAIVGMLDKAGVQAV